ncbi:E3 ubiquitin-protein ligase PUB23-like [Magnolia sinica]|uniref:E3 ubiquitin-protein ligase PUB23-like n=1 Tax=Magnolia sinica TaxID=86752 RepID=UPI00265924C5|nr:E3 ubiquitin-protein ligase PUB23-like [Magnolia sinica]
MDIPEIPPFFICPISLQIMKDPVTLSTGVTYDRESIYRWVFSYNHNTCPVTKQPLTDHNLTPNTTLLRLIQSWSRGNSSNVAIQVDSSKRVPDFSAFGKIIAEVRVPRSQIKSLRKIKSIIQESDYNRRCMEEGGVASLIVSLITETDPRRFSDPNDDSVATEEAIKVLYVLKPSPETLKKLAEDKNGKLIASLSLMMQDGSYQSRIHATLLLKSVFKLVDDIYKTELRAELFDSIVEIIKDQNSNQATKAALSILTEVTPFGCNSIKAVGVGLVTVLVELLAESNERRSCEVMLGVLEVLCGKAEGRAAFIAHPASMAAVSSKILKVSQAANERSLKVLLLVCRFCERSVVLEMMEVGVVGKVFMVVQAECSRKAKERAKEILGLHMQTWSKSPCFSSNMWL